MVASMTDELAPDLYEAVKRHCARGDELAGGQKFRDAIVEYNKAWALLPDPKDHWNAATWILAAIGDAAFSGGYIDLAKQAFDDVILCPGALGNAFLHLRRGQLLFDAGDLDAAADELVRAYMGGGREIFEVEAPKYFEFLSTRAAV
jgi:tetratricopeptide (TPR) repeat protein